MANCKRGGYCGDGRTNGKESCDDGLNDGTYGTCNPDCTLAPRCGDGRVQADYGEECEPAMSNDPNCTATCRVPGGCGDGLIQRPNSATTGRSSTTATTVAARPVVSTPHTVAMASRMGQRNATMASSTARTAVAPPSAAGASLR